MSSLPTSTPAAQGVDAAGIQAFLDALEAEPHLEPHSLMLLRHGRVVASGWWAPYASDRPQLLYSLSKSFTATAAGFAVAEGLMGLDDPVISYFPEFEADIVDGQWSHGGERGEGVGGGLVVCSSRSGSPSTCGPG